MFSYRFEALHILIGLRDLTQFEQTGGLMISPYVRKDVAFGINIRRGEREGQASESATIGGV